MYIHTHYGFNAQADTCVEWFNPAYNTILASAFIGALDYNGQPLFIGRVKANGEIIPGKVVPSHGRCYFTKKGTERSDRTYEVMIAKRPLVWIPASNGLLPAKAVSAGYTRCHEALFIGRCYHQGLPVLGYIQPSEGRCFIAYGGKEYSYKNYEALAVPPTIPPQPNPNFYVPRPSTNNTYLFY